LYLGAWLAKFDFTSRSQAASHPALLISLLLSQAGLGDANSVRELINVTGVDIEVVDQNGATALVLAVKCGCLKVVQVLVNAETVANAIDNQGKTALMRAAGFVTLMDVKVSTSILASAAR